MPEAIQFEPERIQFEPESTATKPAKFRARLVPDLSRVVPGMEVAEPEPLTAQERQRRADEQGFGLLTTPLTQRLPAMANAEELARSMTPQEQARAARKMMGTLRQFRLAQQVSPIAAQEEMSAKPELVEGITAGARNLIEGFTSPIGIATLGMSALPRATQRLVSLAFATQMATQTPELARELGYEFGKPPEQRDTAKIARLITEGTGTAAFTTLAVKHGLTPAPAPAPSLAPKAEAAVAEVKFVPETKPTLAPLTEKALTQTIGEEHAIQERVPEAVHVDEPSINRPALVEGIPTPEKPATTQVERQPTPVPAPEAYELKPEQAGEAKPTEIRGTPLGNMIRRMRAEDRGMELLSQAEELGLSPKTIVDNFFKNTYPDLPPDIRAFIHRQLNGLTGFKPGDAIITGKPTKSWQEIAEEGLELPDDVGSLKGGERGLIASMIEAEGMKIKAAKAEINKGVLTGSELPSGQPLPAEAVSRTEPGATESVTQTVTPEPTSGQPIGMGGALAKGEPAKPELAQLTDSIKTLARQNPVPEPSKVFDFGQSMSKAKDSASSAVAGLKAVAGYMKERLIGKPVVNDFQQALGERHLALSESADVARKFFKNAERAVPDKTTQEAISDWIDTGGSEEMLTKAAAETKDKYKAGYEAAKNLTPEQKTLAQNVRNYFESRLQDAIDAGILEDGIEDYIHRIYEVDSPWKQGVIAELRSGIFTGRPAFAKQRVFEYDFEAEKAGKQPIKSFVKRIAAYDLSLNKAIADRTLIKDMMKIKMPDGRPMIDVGGIGTKIEKEGVTEATLIKPSFKPRDTETPKNNRSDFKYYDHPSLRKWKWASTDEAGNPIFVQGDVLVHPDAIGKVKALFERSAVRQNPLGRAMLGVSSTIKQTMLDLSGFHFVQIGVHAFEHRTFRPVREIDYSNPDVRGMIKGGLVVGDTRGYEMFSEGLSGTSLTRFIPSIGPKFEALKEHLFNSYIPRFKVAMGLHALERNRVRYPQLTAEEQYRLVANESNAAFGELNYELLGRSKTTQDMMRLALLAPDFLEARGRFVAEAGTYYGREQLQALLGGAVVMYLTARIMNKLLDDEYHFEPKNAFSVVYKGKAYSLRTIQGDLLHVASEPGKFVYTRLNPVYGRTSFEFVTGRDYFGRKRDLAEQAKDFATTAVPISLRGVLNPREQNLLESFLNAFGVTERRSTSTSTIFQLSEQFKKEHHILTDPAERIYDPEKDPYRNIQQAAFFSSPETIAKEIANTVAKGQVTEAQISRHFLNFANRPFTGSHANERKFIQSLTEDQRKLYSEAMQERRKVVTQFQQGYKLYWAQKKRQR